jgi:hypothetical protein
LEVEVMAAKISEQLRRALEAAGPGDEIPVIITLAAQTRAEDLAEHGLKIAHAYENIAAVSGTLTAEALKRLARLDAVERIEYDGTFEALPRPGQASA